MADRATTAEATGVPLLRRARSVVENPPGDAPRLGMTNARAVR
jgi:hypothetical protein